MILSLSLFYLFFLHAHICIYTETDPLIINSPYMSLITSLHHYISLLEPGRFCWIIHKYPIKSWIKSWISYKITMFLGKNGRFGRTFTPGSCSSSAWPRRKIYGPVPAVMGGVMGQPSGKLTKKMEKQLLSGKLTYNYRKSPCFMGKFTINGDVPYVKLPEGTYKWVMFYSHS